ncbi:MAG: hypothetical protein JW892_09550 [Anaerolineae bacterium]|nr:hypothetical protein [Anaerolineae bacterium]
MPDTKLILIEGIPGSGKSATARTVYEQLEKRGKRPKLFLEGDWNHPADFESVACLNKTEYGDLLAQFPQHKAFLAQHARQEDGEVFFSYRRMQHECATCAPNALFEALARFEIYELPAQKHQDLLRRRWEKFATQAAREESTYVFECCFLQNPITTLLARHNLAEKQIYHHILALARSIQPLQPKLVYLARRDVSATLEAVRRERPQEWADFVTWYLTGQAYGQARGLEGFEGVKTFYAARQKLETDWLRTLPISKIIITDDKDWETRHRQMLSLLEQ